MDTLIIYCHPYAQSFNHVVLERVQSNLNSQGINYQLIDLYAEHFDPTYSAEELSLYHQGGTVDPLVRKYLALLKSCQTVIFITPCWWNSIPGMLKGFIDKVMKEGSNLSHTVTRTGIKGLLTNVQHCYVLTTSTSPTWYLRFFCGNAIQRVFVNTTLKQLGFEHRKWLNFGEISWSSPQRRQRYLQKIAQYRFK